MQKVLWLLTVRGLQLGVGFWEETEGGVLHSVAVCPPISEENDWRLMRIISNKCKCTAGAP